MKKKSRVYAVFTVIFAILMIACIIGTNIALSYKAVIDSYFGLSTYKTVNSNKVDTADTEYFKSPYVLDDAEWKGQESKNGDAEYYDNKALAKSDNAIGKEVEAEGTVLLWNHNNALPLSEGDNVSDFGISSNNLSYAGAGSGAVDISRAPKLKKALKKSGLNVNPTLAEFYEKGAAKDYKRSSKSFFQTGAYAINEAPWSVYTGDVKNSFASYGDAAIMVVTREGGEDNDLPRTNSDFEASRKEAATGLFDTKNEPFNSDTSNDGQDGNYLSLSAEEREVLQQLTKLKEDGVFKKVVLIINASNGIQFDFLQDASIDVDAALWIGSVGYSGIYAVGDILVGKTNPSGSIPDTFYKDAQNTPAMVNFGKTKFNNADEELDKLGADCYTAYQEGIYVGYKYTESRYYDAMMGQNNAGDFDYDELVAFPFGYGESYTDFDISNLKVDEKDDSFEMSVKVTNTGKVAGKKAVQIYMSSPYTAYDKENLVEKSAVEMVAFGKTKLLEPGKSETLKISVDKDNLKAYDSYGEKTYIVDEGDYRFVVAQNAHEAANTLLASEGQNMENADMVGNSDLIYTYHQDSFDAKTYSVSATGEKITNQFDNADLAIYDNGAQADVLPVLSRQDWVGTYPVAEDHASGSLTFTDQMREDVSRSEDFTVEEDVDAKMPIYGAANGLTLADLRGADFDDPQWEELLDEMTFDEMAELCSQGYHSTVAISSIAKPATKDENGPVGITRTFMGSDTKCMAYPSCPVMAATMNAELIERMGEQIGIDALHADIQGLYAPGVNIHRTSYCGRNYEYYSEDVMLSGLICQAEVMGIQSQGMYVYVKHFALNDQETLRHGICTFADEQTIRENYLKAFEYPLSADKGNGHAVMTAFNRIGVVWAGANQNLIQNVLRGEWGFDGFALTDCWADIGPDGNSGNVFANAARTILAGGDSLDGTPDTPYDSYRDSATFCQALRNSTKRILYVQANSSAMNGIAGGTQVKVITSWWQIACYALTTAMAALTVLFLIFTIRRRSYEKARR